MNYNLLLGLAHETHIQTAHHFIVTNIKRVNEYKWI